MNDFSDYIFSEKRDNTHLECAVLKYHMKQMKEEGRIHLLSVVNSTAKQAMQQNKPLVSTQWSNTTVQMQFVNIKDAFTKSSHFLNTKYLLRVI